MMNPENTGEKPPPYDQPAGGYPPQPAGINPQQPGYNQPPPGSYNQPPPGSYNQPPPVGYNQQPPAGYNQQPPGGYVQPVTVVVTQPVATTPIVIANRPPDYMISSVLVCLCCFWPTGLGAIYYSLRAKSFAASGDMTEADRMARNARNLIIASVVVGVICIVLAIVLRVVNATATTRKHY